MSDSILSKDSFYQELVSRFFHTSSYFYHCLSSEIERVVEQADREQRQHYLLMGTLLDKLVAAGSAVDELSILARISGFDEFHDKLSRGADYLYTEDLDTDGLKVEIESLAHSMFNSALLAFQNEDAMSQLRLYLGRADQTEKNLQLTEDLPSENDPTLETDVSSEGEINLPRPDEMADKNELPSDEADMEVVFQSELDNDREEGRSSEIVDEQPDGPNRSRPQREPDSLVGVFEQELKKHLAELSTVIAADAKADLEAVDGGLEVVESISMVSMIYGFEAFEQLALKTRRQVEELKQAGDENFAAIIVHFKELQQLLTALIERGPDSVDIKLVQELAGKFRNQGIVAGPDTKNEKLRQTDTDGPPLDDQGDAAEKAWTDSSVLPEGELQSLPAQDEDAMTLSEVTPSLQPAIKDEELPALIAPFDTVGSEEQDQPDPVEIATNFAENFADATFEQPELPAIATVVGPESSAVLSEATGPDSSVREINIPGSGDEDLLELISDINNPHAKVAHDDGKTNVAFSANFTTLQPDFTGPEQAPPVTQVDIGEADPLDQYEQKSGMYFNVVEFALDSLEANTSQIAALEDIELAAKALSGLTLKFGLTQIASLPDLLAQTMTSVRANNYVLTPEDRAGLREIFHEFKRMRSNDDAGSQHFQELLTAIRLLQKRAEFRQRGPA